MFSIGSLNYLIKNVADLQHQMCKPAQADAVQNCVARAKLGV